jgi:hypothetical protein
MKRNVLLYFAILALTVSAVPNVVSVFANQHTFYSDVGLNCVTCHSDVKSQLDLENYVNAKHKEAALSNNYTTYLAIGGVSYDQAAGITVADGAVWIWNGSVWINYSNPSQYMNVSLDTNSNGAIGSDEVCLLCHSRSLVGADTHAGTVAMSACDEDRCHGNRLYKYNDPNLLGVYGNVAAAGYNLSLDNIHREYYLTMSNQTSMYPAVDLFGYTHGNVNNSYVSRGYYVCLGCHSDVSTNVTLVFPKTYDHGDIDEPKGRYQ